MLLAIYSKQPKVNYINFEWRLTHLFIIKIITYGDIRLEKLKII